MEVKNIFKKSQAWNLPPTSVHNVTTRIPKQSAIKTEAEIIGSNSKKGNYRHYKINKRPLSIDLVRSQARAFK